MTGYFADLERELVAAAERQRDESRRLQPLPQKRFGGRRVRVIATALALVVVTGVPAAAVTGVFRPHREPDGLLRLTQRRVVAEGTTPDRRHWELLASQSGAGFCFGIRLPTSTPGGDGNTSVSEGCGGASPGSLKVATISGGSIPQNGVAFGMAPGNAKRVRVEARGIAVTVKTVDDDAGLDGRFYVAQLPIRRSLGPTVVVALDDDGAVIGRATIG